MMLLLSLAGVCLAATLAWGDAVAGDNATGAAARALKEDAVCTRCHDETEFKPVLSIYQTPHGVRADSRTPSCQSCHGQSEKHVTVEVKDGSARAPTDIQFGRGGAYPASPPEAQTAACITCHRGGQRTHWAGGAHEANQVACSDCHKVHQPADRMVTRKTQAEACLSCHKEQRAEVRKTSTHPIEVGKVVCSDCHNPHGSVAPKLLKKNSVTETCFTCHAKQRGPFLWEHQPVNEDCTICHTPHGSNQAPLLKSRGTILCQECHNGPHNSKTSIGPNAGSYQTGMAAGANPSTQAVGRGCMNCHTMVHGSNSPSGAFLAR